MLRKKDYPAAIKYKRALYELHLTPLLVAGDKPDRKARGFCQKTREVKRIVLRENLSRKVLFETLLHEILHLLEFEERMDIPHGVIDKIEAPLARLLLENFHIRFKKLK